jgi:hypothetical protein
MDKNFKTPVLVMTWSVAIIFVAVAVFFILMVVIGAKGGSGYLP